MLEAYRDGRRNDRSENQLRAALPTLLPVLEELAAVARAKRIAVRKPVVCRWRAATESVVLWNPFGPAGVEGSGEGFIRPQKRWL